MDAFTLRRARLLGLALLLILPGTGPAWASCGSAFCTLSTDWNVQGTFAHSGVRMDLRSEYVHQGQLRTGAHREVFELPAPGGESTEIKTINRNLLATIDYSDQLWGFTIQAPVVDRVHSHLVDPGTGPVVERWDFRELGDLRMTVRHALYSGAGSGDATRITAAGFTAGLKLPTGDTSVLNGDNVPAERALAPGTGTTGLILGAYVNGRVPRMAWFADLSAQKALAQHANFRPGNRFLADLGATVPLAWHVSLLAQLNAQWRGRDVGLSAEPDHSGGRSVYLSPGLAVPVGERARLYVFMQQPLYQYVNGTQLTANRSYALGISRVF